MTRVGDSLYEALPGWLDNLDLHLFESLLKAQQADSATTGNLLEVGVYLGKVAVLLGDFRAPDEDLWLCDPFLSDGADPKNAQENASYYAGLSRAAFEANFALFHSWSPKIFQGLSHDVFPLLSGQQFRFIHIDGSHLYEHVSHDLGSALPLLGPGGILVVDDFRARHTPDVAVATWEFVRQAAISVLCLSEQKLYLCEPASRERYLHVLEASDDLRLESVPLLDGVVPLVSPVDPGPPPLTTRLRRSLTPPALAYRLQAARRKRRETYFAASMAAARARAAADERKTEGPI